MSLEEMEQELSKYSYLVDKEYLLTKLGRVQHIDYSTNKGKSLAKNNPKRFYNIGSRVFPREDYKYSCTNYYNFCISNSIYLYERFPIIFEFYDELVNGIVKNDIDENLLREYKRKDRRKLLQLAYKMNDNISFNEKEKILINEGRVQHIDNEKIMGREVAATNPDRFFNIGKFTILKDNDPNYYNHCILTAIYLYDNFPLLFEYYDELINETVYTDKSLKKIIK